MSIIILMLSLNEFFFLNVESVSEFIRLFIRLMQYGFLSIMTILNC